MTEMMPMHGQLKSATQGALTFEGIITAGETRPGARGTGVTFQVNLTTIRIDVSKLLESTDVGVFERELRASYPGVTVVRESDS